MKHVYKGIATAGAAALAVALAAPAAGQSSSEARAGAGTTAHNPCDKLSGKNREDCTAQIRRDDAQRGVDSRSASAGGNRAARGDSGYSRESTTSSGSSTQSFPTTPGGNR